MVVLVEATEVVVEAVVTTQGLPGAQMLPITREQPPLARLLHLKLLLLLLFKLLRKVKKLEENEGVKG